MRRPTLRPLLAMMRASGKDTAAAPMDRKAAATVASTLEPLVMSLASRAVTM